MNVFIRGTCQEMCTKAEIDLRIREKLVHFFETDPDAGRPGVPDRHRMVKEFSRSAADRRQPKPWEIRTPSMLLETVHYLLTIVLTDTRRPYYQRFEFIFDRMRAIRQEMVIQNLPAMETLPILEPIVRFLAYSAYHLCEVPIAEFDPKICSQHLQECLKKVLRCYEELDQASITASNSNRFEMERLYLSFNIGSTEATQSAITRYGASEPKLRLHITTQLECHRGNYFAVMQNMFQYAPLEAALASLQLPQFRRQILHQFSIAYQSRVQTVPLEWLESILHYEGRERTCLLDDCRHYNLQLVARDNGQRSADGNRNWAVKFEKATFDGQRCAIPPRKVTPIEDALENCGNISRMLLDGFND
ncbi:germinal-center associated nuclear protein isoform X2 [Anopheles maculipalpis]|uniref:germinal-center associated nuclear protein isoform X2 n=1 Tax=Anopheles maculipalpis TaxID=1496333 RepID=UPI00215931DD|nr:germinal-center associated nuclear protein isoform X2 [Anopheles maculipalpis]